MELPIFNNNFWNIVKKIDELEKKVSVKSFMSSFASDDFHLVMLENAIEFLRDLNFHVKIEEIEGEYFILPNMRNEKIHMKLSVSEWISLQAHFPLMNELSHHDFHKSLVNKWEEINIKYPQYNLFNNTIEQEVRYEFKDGLTKRLISFVDDVETAFNHNQLIFINIENKKYEIFPHKLIMLEGELSIIGEETSDRCLISYVLDEISSIKINPINEYLQNYSRFEVEEFIMAIRVVSGREERLVLKIGQDEVVDLNPAYQFMGHPYMTANSEGDYIWAASVEVSSKLYDWLMSMGKSIEILDPMELKSEFEKYREVKIADLSKNNLKKAS